MYDAPALFPPSARHALDAADGSSAQAAAAQAAAAQDAAAQDAAAQDAAKISVEAVDFWYGDKHALKSVSLRIRPRRTTAFIGPSGCGKTTLLKLFNRMQDDVPQARMTGRILLDGADVYDPALDVSELRRRFGWVAQKPNPFPWSVYDNIAYGPLIHGLVESGAAMDEHVENCLEQAGLWGELKDRLREPGTSLSGGQQQRLCIARALSIAPEALLMDEPCGSLDPLSTERIEALIATLSERLTIVLITHNMEQAARVAEDAAFFQLGEIVEARPTADLFAAPRTEACRAYLAGRFG